MSKFNKGDLVLVELSSPRQFNGDLWKGDIVGGETACRFIRQYAVSDSGSDNFGDHGRVHALAKISCYGRDEGYVTFVNGGEEKCYVTKASLFLFSADAQKLKKTKDDLNESVVIATPKVIKHLEALGFENLQGVSTSAIGLWIKDNMFVQLNSAHEKDSRVNFLNPDDVLEVELPPVKVTVELEISRSDADEIIDDEELTWKVEDLVVKAIQDSQS